MWTLPHRRAGHPTRLALIIALAWTGLAGTPQAADDSYRAGKQAMRAREWSQAVTIFQDLFQANSERADAAGYWLAFSYNKQKDSRRALEILSQLRQRFPKSSWIEDATVLEAEIRSDAGQPVKPTLATDDTLRRAAIDSLMYMKPADAMPLIDKVLSGDYSASDQERALFVLSQIDHTDARQRMRDFALSESNPKLTQKAIQFLGMGAQQADLNFLMALYEQKPTNRRDVIQALNLAQSWDLLSQLRERERDPDLQVLILTFLGRTDKARQFGDFYLQATSLAEKEALLQGMLIAQQTGQLLRVVREESTKTLREQAITNLGIIGACDQLETLYSEMNRASDKAAIITGFFLARDCDLLADLALVEADESLRIEAIAKLGLLGNQHQQTLLAIYREKGPLRIRQAVLSALFVGRQDQALIDIAKTESNSELKSQAVQYLGMLNTASANAYIKSLLDL